jgi:hypothetical protein
MATEYGIISRQTVNDIATAIREKNEDADIMYPSQMPAAIRAINGNGSGGVSGPVTDAQVSLTDTEDGLTLKQKNDVELAKAKLQAKYRSPVAEQILRSSGISSSSNVVTVEQDLLTEGTTAQAFEIGRPVSPDRIIINSIASPTSRSYPGCKRLYEGVSYERDCADTTYPGGPDINTLSFADIAIRIDTSDGMWSNYEGLLGFYSLDPDSPYSIWENTDEVKEYIAALKECGYMDIKDTRAYAIRLEIDSDSGDLEIGDTTVYVSSIGVNGDAGDKQFQNELFFGETCLYREAVRGVSVSGNAGDVIPVPGLFHRTVVQGALEGIEVFFKPYFFGDSPDVLSGQTSFTMLDLGAYDEYFSVDIENETITLKEDISDPVLWLYACTPKTYKVALPPWCPSFSFKQYAGLAQKRTEYSNDENSTDDDVRMEGSHYPDANYAIQIFAEIALTNGLLQCHYIPVGYCSSSDYHDRYFTGAYENILRYSYVSDDFDMGRSANMANMNALSILEDTLFDTETHTIDHKFNEQIDTTGKYPYAEITKTYGNAIPIVNILKSTGDLHDELIERELTNAGGLRIRYMYKYLKFDDIATSDISIDFEHAARMLPHHRYLFANCAGDGKLSGGKINFELTGDLSSLTTSRLDISNSGSIYGLIYENQTDTEVEVGLRMSIANETFMGGYGTSAAPRLLDLSLMFGENNPDETESIKAIVIQSSGNTNFADTGYFQNNVIAIRSRKDAYNPKLYDSAINEDSAILPVPLAIRNLPGYGAEFMGARNYVDWSRGIYHQEVGIVRINSKNNKAGDVVALVNSIPDSYCLVSPSDVFSCSATLIKINHGYTDGFNYDPAAEIWQVEEEEPVEEPVENVDEGDSGEYGAYGGDGYGNTPHVVDFYRKMHVRQDYLDPSLTINYNPNASIVLPNDIQLKQDSSYVIYKLASPVDIDISKYIKTNRLKLDNYLYTETEAAPHRAGHSTILEIARSDLVEYKTRTPKSS